MKPSTDRMVPWAPRVLAIIVVAFLSMFALDVFEEEKSPAARLPALLIHLVPSFLLIAVLLLAWRRPWLGAVLFGAAALGYAISVGSGHPDWIAIISGPMLLTAALYFLSWVQVRRRPGSAAH